MKSLAIIPDGNRRYAKKHGLPLEVAYRDGFKKVGKAMEWARDYRVESMSFWALSLENFQNRSALELRTIFSLMQKQLAEAMVKEDQVNEQQAQVKFFGRTELLPKQLRESMAALERKTEGNKKLLLNVGVAYSGQDELVRASTLLAADMKAGKVDERALASDGGKIFSNYLFTKTAPDLIIRTGDVQRLSGFLPYQSAYSEYYFSRKLWPEFTRADFAKALEYYDGTQRRFGR